ncbi:MAG: DUF481 domain-containing protein [Candidatus Omnitrophota bacterium]|nr:MAG: DUF481 domain-containing protein [Candidatus Omnitrophota bacterium]
MMRSKLTLCIFVTIISAFSLYGEEIQLINGDKITGEIVSQDERSVRIKTAAMGIVSVRRDFIKKEKVQVTQKPPQEEIEWQKELSFGYSKNTGNTQNSELTLLALLNRKTYDDEFTAKGDFYYSSANRKMDSRKWYTMLRYAYSFWQRKWYHFYRIEADHDRFADIDYRLTPSTGIGYWFSDTEDWKAMVECGIGLEHTEFRDDTEDSDELILIPRFFIEKRLINELRISQDTTFYPSLENIGDYRVRSETALMNPISEQWALKLSLIIDYDSDPARDKKKKDTRFVSSLVYAF